MNWLLLNLLASTAHAGILPIPTTTNYNVYLSPTGVDTNSGLSPASPIKTLTQAQTLLKLKNPQQNVVVHIASGTYSNQFVKWTWVRPTFSIKFQGEGLTKPIFEGCAVGTTCIKSTFFTLASSNGQPSNVIIDNLQIQRYWMAISLDGVYTDFTRNNWNNTISNSAFTDIGNGYAPLLPYSFAAVRLYNSRNNKVINNTFKNIINVGTYGSYIHAVYAASWASSNLISGNRFENVSGDVVRTRDSSDYNEIVGNTFIKAGAYAMASDWYCAASTCEKLECPSFENKFTSNKVGLNYSLRTIPFTAYSGASKRTGCPSLPLLTSLRFASSLNVLFLP